jgi:peptidyl-prolyl cis-trans isomerase C
MQKISCRPLARAALAAILLAMAAGTSAAQDEDKVVATINGEVITEADIALAESGLDRQFDRLTPEQRRVAALSALIEIKLLAAEAEKQGLADSETFKRQMAFLRERALHSELIQKEVLATISEEEVRARYDKELAETPPQNEVRARHILVKTREEAEEIISALNDGGDFEALAKEKSTDGAASQGGDLGYFGPGRMVPEFEKAAFALEVGAHSQEPVETQFGFHVIKVEDKRAIQPPAFEDVKERVRNLMQREKYLKLVADHREAANVEISDPALKSALEAIEKEE